MQRFLSFACLVLASGVMVGCATRSEIPKTDVETLRGRLRFERVFFKPLTADPSVENSASVLGITKETAIAYLDDKKLFQQVGPYEGSVGADSVVVEGHLLAMRIVSGSARFWGGAFAGRSYMKVHARILDSSGAVIAERDLEGSPNSMGSAWSFGASDRELPASMGVLMGEYVLSNAGK